MSNNSHLTLPRHTKLWSLLTRYMTMICVHSPRFVAIAPRRTGPPRLKVDIQRDRQRIGLRLRGPTSLRRKLLPATSSLGPATILLPSSRDVLFTLIRLPSSRGVVFTLISLLLVSLVVPSGIRSLLLLRAILSSGNRVSPLRIIKRGEPSIRRGRLGRNGGAPARRGRGTRDARRPMPSSCAGGGI